MACQFASRPPSDLPIEHSGILQPYTGYPTLHLRACSDQLDPACSLQRCEFLVEGVSQVHVGEAIVVDRGDQVSRSGIAFMPREQIVDE
ncbi:hypothetical protein [Mesorhizobium sp.]|uniref:hypothetical protein n=1 Tax=Mesorhizobium sp. TaxID=1871066 RepID=UPI002600C715|nr:hypothetical protein [Mesorhizobium sp.]